MTQVVPETKYRHRPVPTHISGQDWVGAMNQPIERFRTQRGQWIVFADGHLYARYYEGIGERRKKISHRLADKGTFVKMAHTGSEKLAARKGLCSCANCRLLATHMKTVNSCQKKDWSADSTVELTVGDVFENSYLPAVKETLSWSTLDDYKKTWDRYIAEYIAAKPIRSFTVSDASDFLKKVAARKLNVSSIALCRAVARNVFTYSRSESIYQGVNPFDDLKIFGVKIRKRGKTIAYDQKEMKAVLDAIPAKDRSARLFWLLCAIFALGPAEAAGLKWEDIDWKHKTGVVLHVQRSCPKGHVQDVMKADSRDRFVLLSSSIKVMDALNKHRNQCSGKGWLFKQRNGNIVHSAEFPKRRIAPYAKKAIGDRWRGPYAARRGALTAHRIITGNSNSASGTAGHANTITTDKHYVKMPSAVAFAGQVAVGAEFDKL
jgi:integrase